MVRKVSEILQENDVARRLYNQNKQTEEYEQPSLLKTALAGTASGLVSTAPSAVGFVSSLPEISYHSLRGLFNDEYPTKDKVLETLGNNKLIQLGGYLDEKVKSAFGIDDITKLDELHQAALMAGDFAPIIATGGSYGAVKAGQKIINKTVKNSLKKAAAKGLSKEAGKKLAKRNALIADTVMGFATPGVQVSKDAGKLGKLFQVGLQAAPSLGMNEYIQKQNNNVGLFGDYREPKDDEVDREKITLIKDKRKFKGKEEIPENMMDNVVDYEIDPSIKQEEDHFWRNALLGTAAVGAALTGLSRYTTKGKELVNDVLKSATEPSYGYDSLSAGEKFYMTTANRMSFMDKQIKNKQVKSEKANTFYRDKKVYTDNAWTRGSIGDVIQLDVIPEHTKVKMQTLAETNPVLYQEFEDFLELSRQIQHETNAFNIGNNTKLSTLKFMKEQPDHPMELNGLFKGISNQKINEKLIDMYADLSLNSNVREIFNDLDKLNRGLLKYRYKMNTLDIDGYKNALKNRTMFDNLLLYKPGIEDIGEQGYIKRLYNSMFKSPFKSDRNYDYIENLIPRGTQNSVHNAANFLNVFEDSFKRNIRDIEMNKMVSNYCKNGVENINKSVNAAIKQFKIDVEDVFKQKKEFLEQSIKNAKNTKQLQLFDKYTKELNKLEQDFSAELTKTKKDLVNMMNIRKIGESDIKSIDDISLSSIHNTANDIDGQGSILGNSIRSYFNEAKPTSLGILVKGRRKEGIIPAIEGNKIVYYQMDPHFARAMLYDPVIVNGFAKAVFASKNFLQSTITGKYAPWFIPRAIKMTIDENMLTTPTIGKKLNVDLSMTGYVKEITKNYKALHSRYIANQQAKELTRKIAKINSKGKLSDADKLQIDKYKDQLTTILNTKVSDQEDLINKLARGGTLSNKPININEDLSINMTKGFKVDNKIKADLIRLYGATNAEKISNMLSMFSDYLRDTPSLSLYTYVAKQVMKQRGLTSLNQEVLDEISKIINTHTANTVLRGSGEGFVGGASELIRNYMPYGNILINSITPKIVASGASKGIKNLKKLGIDLLDADVRYVDVLREMQDIAKQVGSNKFLQGLFFISVVPKVLEYTWNHSSQENIDAYYNNSNYNKASKLVFTNMFGKGRHLTIPLDQEVALSNTIVYSYLDSMLGMSRYNVNDPAFNKSKLRLEALGRSFGADFQPAKILANLSGYNFSMDPARFGIEKLPKNILNEDLSETAYENGIANQEITALVNTLFGQLGSAFLSAAEEGKVGARSGTVFGDIVTSFLDKTVGTIGLIQTDATRNMSLSNDTIQEVYKKREILKKIATIKTKNPQQQAVYDLVKMYNRNRIKDIQDQISLMRKEINHIKANSKTSDGQTTSFYSRKAKLNEMVQKLQQLYALEYNEYNKLDNLLQQQYGNNINIENFMQQFYTGEQ